MKTCIIICTLMWLLKWVGRINIIILSHGQHIESSHSKFKIITKNDTDESKYDENDTTKYEIEDDGIQVRYKFKDGVKCVGLKYDDTSVWSYDSTKDGENYPSEISINHYTNNVRVKFGSKMYIYANVNDKWLLSFESEVIDDIKNYTMTQNSSPEDLLSKLLDLKIKIVTINEYVTKINDISEFTTNKSINATLYKLKSDKTYCQIEYNDKIIFKNKIGNELEYPIILYIYMDEDVFCFNSNPLLFMYERLGTRIVGRGRFMKKYLQLTTDPLKVESMTFNLKVKTEDKYNPNQKNEQKDIKIQRKGQNLQIHKFKSEEKCIEISCEDCVIWKHDPNKHGDNYPTQVYFDFLQIMLIKVKLNRMSYVYKYTDKWILSILYIDASLKKESLGESSIIESAIYP